MNENDLQAKKIYIRKILDIYLNSNNSDVIHAAESLAKLSFSLVPYTESKLSDKDQNNLLEAYVNWASIYPESNESSIYYDRLFEFLNSENDEYREIMAYGTKYLGRVDSCNWNCLADLALNESTESLVGVYLLCGAYVTCPDTERNNPNTKIIGDRIKEIAKGDNLKNKYEAFIALGSFASPCDVDFIKQEMLRFKSNKNKSDNALDEKALDLLSAISYAFLKTTSNKSN
jgi:SSS family solute:Na+ symporter